MKKEKRKKEKRKNSWKWGCRWEKGVRGKKNLGVKYSCVLKNAAIGQKISFAIAAFLEEHGSIPCFL